jgi:hypothetical protein
MVISSVRYVRVPEGNSNFTGGSSHVVYVDYILFFSGICRWSIKEALWYQNNSLVVTGTWMEKMTFPSENSGDYSGLMDFNGF